MTAPKPKLTGSLRSVGEALRQIRTRLDEIERETERLLTEREDIRSAPITRAEAVELLDARLAGLRRKTDSFIDGQVAKLAHGQDISLSRIFEKPTANGSYPNPELTAGLLVDVIRERMVEAIESSGRFSEDSLPLAERPAAIAKIDEKVEKFDAEREALLDELRNAGFSVGEGLEPVEPGQPSNAHVIDATPRPRYTPAELDQLNRGGGASAATGGESSSSDGGN